MQQLPLQEETEEQYIQKRINRLRIYNTFLIIIGLAISVIIIVAAEPTTGIILLTVCWAIIGLIMVYFTGRIKNLNIMNTRTAPYAEQGQQYSIPIYSVQQQAIPANSANYPYNAYPNVQQAPGQPYVASPYQNDTTSKPI